MLLKYKPEPGIANRMRNGQLEFLDRDGVVLARASIDTRRGVVWLAHPDIGQCGPGLSEAVRIACFRTQAAWIPLWAERVRHANVALERCGVAHVPVNLYTRRDNRVLWWLPLANARGRPYTRHIATLNVNRRLCG